MHACAIITKLKSGKLSVRKCFILPGLNAISEIKDVNHAIKTIRIAKPHFPLVPKEILATMQLYAHQGALRGY
jgi:hypothetical protein